MPYLSALEVCSRQGAIQIHVYLTLPHPWICCLRTFHVQMTAVFTFFMPKFKNADRKLIFYNVVFSLLICRYSRSKRGRDCFSTGSINLLLMSLTRTCDISRRAASRRARSANIWLPYRYLVTAAMSEGYR